MSVSLLLLKLMVSVHVLFVRKSCSKYVNTTKARTRAFNCQYIAAVMFVSVKQIMTKMYY